jgi:hypothetical protein
MKKIRILLLFLVTCASANTSIAMKVHNNLDEAYADLYKTLQEKSGIDYYKPSSTTPNSSSLNISKSSGSFITHAHVTYGLIGLTAAYAIYIGTEALNAYRSTSKEEWQKVNFYQKIQLIDQEMKKKIYARPAQIYNWIQNKLDRIQSTKQ